MSSVEVLVVDSEKVRRVVSSLLDDRSRQGHLRLDDVIRAIDRRGLTPEETLAVQLTLDSSQVELLEEVDSSTPTARKFAPSSDDDLLGLYLKEIRSYRLLSADDEVLLGRRMKVGELAQQAIGPNLEQAPSLSVRLVDEAQEARDRMIVSNLRLVVSIARRRRSGSDSALLDLIQEGTLGLIKAVHKFDHQKGYKFSTYATWWINQSISRFTTDRGRTIRLPVYLHEKLWLLERERRRLQAELGEEPEISKLSESTGLPEKKIERLLTSRQEPLSLDLPMGGEDDHETLGDFVEDTLNDDPERRLMRRELVDVLLRSVASLTERQTRVLRLRFGIDDGVERTLQEIGEIFGVTRERIRQIESKALQKLRLKLSSANARRYYGLHPGDYL